MLCCKLELIYCGVHIPSIAFRYLYLGEGCSPMLGLEFDGVVCSTLCCSGCFWIGCSNLASVVDLPLIVVALVEILRFVVVHVEILHW